MLKLPTNAGEWGFVIVLSVLFTGLTFAIVYSQVHLHGMRKEQAYADTESNLYVLAEHIRGYYREREKLPVSLKEMGLDENALKTRHAIFDDAMHVENGVCTLHATLIKFGEPTCTMAFSLDGNASDYTWSN